MSRSTFRNRSVWTGGLVRVLIAGQILGTIPTAQAQDAPRQEAAPAVEVRAAEAPSTEAPSVEVNRTPPAAQALPLTPQFSSPPTDAELARVHVFEEPLIPIGRATTPAENTALALAITTYISAGGGEDLSPFERFLAANPETPWRAALLTGLGIVYRRTGYFSKALTSWEAAWTAAKGAKDRIGNAIADRALGELAELSARLGRFERLEALFAEIGSRDVHGSASERLVQAREGLAKMRNEPGQAFRCGPMALDRIMAYANPNYRPDKRITHAESTQQGTSLLQVRDLSQIVGLNLQMAFRTPGVAPAVPAVVHWKAGHFAALVAQKDGRYLIQDPTFGNELWVTRKALDDEASGYALIPSGALPTGWRSVAADEGGGVWGKGFPGLSNPENQTCQDPTSGGASGSAGGGSGGGGGSSSGGGGCSGSCGMAQYRIHSMRVALNINDQPVGYSPPRGGAVALQASYHQREVFQPQVPAFGNLGPKWTYEWLSFIEDDPANPSAVASVYLRLGGRETYSNFNSSTQSYAPHSRSRAVVVRTSTSPISYERRLADGSKEVYAQSDGSPSVPRKVYLTSWSDPQGNTVSLTYNGLKLVSVTDAIGQVTTLSYELPGDPLKITKVTDPFGRFARFEYNAQGQLWKITDVIGMTSEFAYGTGDFITSLATPYGITRFATGTGEQQMRWVEAIDPLGAVERVEYRHGAPGISPSDPANKVPAGVITFNEYLQARNTFFWDKRASALDPLHSDYTKAVITHWAHDVDANVASGIVESEKKPLENRVWYSYPGQTNPAFVTDFTAGPATVARVLDDGSTQVYRYEYNSSGRVCKTIDPLGRETRYTYGTSNVADAVCTAGASIDLLKVEQKNGSGGYDVIQEYTFNAKHQPLTVKDVAGQITTYTYLTDGRLETVVSPPRNGPDGVTPLTPAERTTTYTYYAIPTPPASIPFNAGRLQSVVGTSVDGGSGPSSSFTYEAFSSGGIYQKSVQTVTDQEGYALTTEYDPMDRPTKLTHPDGSYEATAYNRLDAEARRDRLGRWTRTFYDALRRVRAIRDPIGRTVTYNWCNCGSLDSIVDGAGNKTTWDRDLQGRVKKEIRADGEFWEYTYETTTSRLKTIKDPKQQLKTYIYDLDDKLTGIAYTSEVIPTPDVTFSYRDAQNQPEPYGRLLSMTDATGTTAYDYHPVGTLGATQLKSVDAPVSSDLLEYGYDELGRIRNRKLNGAVNEVTYRFDSLGRLRTQMTPLGNFTYSYDGVTGRALALVYPNAQRVDYGYYGNAGDHRLQQIHNKLPGGATLSKFDYTYDKVGNIETWSQQRGASSAETYGLGYDRADQLRKTTLTSTAGAVLKTYGYGYDNAGNRTVEAVDTVGASTAATTTGYNNRNWITSQSGGGALPVAGLLNETATVTISTAPASVGSDNRFAGQAQVGSGTGQTFTVVATDPSGNVRTNTYQLDVSGSAGGPFTYDDNGNLTSNGVKTYEWDAENRLVAVKQGGNTLASFVYDGNARRYSKTVGTVTHTYLYDGSQLLEERLSGGASGTTKYFDGPGIDQHLAQDQGGTVSYFAADHLGSITDVTTSAGAISLTRQYDPWGTLLSGASTGGYAFTGREWDAETGLYYYRARYYDPKIGRFTSEDPARFRGDVNFYAYVRGNPVNFVDPLGLRASPRQPCPGAPMAQKAYAWVCCIGGKLGICYDPVTVSPKNNRCLMAHEEEHITREHARRDGKCGRGECDAPPCDMVANPNVSTVEYNREHCEIYFKEYYCVLTTPNTPPNFRNEVFWALTWCFQNNFFR